MDSQLQRRRLYWATRRGMLELDLLLQRFLEQRYDALDGDDQAQFAVLLDADDPTLLDWFAGRDLPEQPAQARLVRMIRGEL